MKRYVLVLSIVLFSIVVSADDITLQDSYDWLINSGRNGSYNNNIVDTSAAVMALNVHSASIGDEINYLESMKLNNCWPRNSCRIKDTAFGLYAFYLDGKNITNIEEWTYNAQRAFSGSGRWYLQVVTSSSGMCNIKYKKGNSNIEKNVEVNEGKFPSCSNANWLDLVSCLDPGLESIAYTKFDIDCSDMGNAVINLLYKTGDSIYIVDSLSSNSGDLVYSKGCYGVGANSQCNLENSFYVNWLLHEVQGDVSSLYLRANYQETNPFHNAVLYLITSDNAYLDNLKGLQRDSGSFDNDIVKTSFSLIALKKAGESDSYNKGSEWILKQKRDDGSFGNVFNTAIALYSLIGEGIILPSCTDGQKNQGERGVDCGGVCEAYDDCCNNGVKDSGETGVDCGGVCKECDELCNYNGECEENMGETCHNCPYDCEVCGGDGADEDDEDVCNNDEKCDTNLVDEYGFSENEDYSNCPNDCYCGDKVCDDLEQYDDSCPSDCGGDSGDVDSENGVNDEDEEGGSFLTWIFVFLILCVVGVGGYYFYTKFYKKKGKKGNELDFFKKRREMGKDLVGKSKEKGKHKRFSMSSIFKKEEKSALDKEIDKSIAEAKNMLKK